MLTYDELYFGKILTISFDTWPHFIGEAHHWKLWIVISDETTLPADKVLEIKTEKRQIEKIIRLTFVAERKLFIQGGSTLAVAYLDSWQGFEFSQLIYLVSRAFSWVDEKTKVIGIRNRICEI